MKVKSLAAKLQKHDRDIYEAYTMINGVISGVKSLRSSFINQLEERFGGEANNDHVLSCLMPSVFLNKSSSWELYEHLEELLFWETFLALNRLEVN